MLIDLATLRKDELKIIKKSKKQLKKELSSAKNTLELILKTLSIVQHVRDTPDNKKAVLMISYRVFRILRCVMKTSLEGYYDVSMALLRTAFENSLLMIYLSEREDEAELWFKGKRFAPTFLRQWSPVHGGHIYRDLSEFVHSSFKSVMSLGEYELGEYHHGQFKGIVFLMLAIMAFTVIELSMTFAQELKENEQWHSMFSKIFPKMYKHLKTTLKKEIAKKS